MFYIEFIIIHVCNGRMEEKFHFKFEFYSAINSFHFEWGTCNVAKPICLIADNVIEFHFEEKKLKKPIDTISSIFRLAFHLIFLFSIEFMHMCVLCTNCIECIQYAEQCKKIASKIFQTFTSLRVFKSELGHSFVLIECMYMWKSQANANAEPHMHRSQAHFHTAPSKTETIRGQSKSENGKSVATSQCRGHAFIIFVSQAHER